MSVAKSVAFLGEFKKKTQEIKKHYIHDMYLSIKNYFQTVVMLARFLRQQSVL